MSAATETRSTVIAGHTRAHESAHLHVSGTAHYIDDIPLPANTLHAALGVSRSAFTRLFRLEVGLSFVASRQQACLVAALPRLAAKESITTIAIDLGYDNPAAFSTMFKRILGASPRAYLKRHDAA